MADTPVYSAWNPAIGYMDMAGERYYTPPVGLCVKVGRLVTVSFDLLLMSKGTGTPSPVQITGLPYAATGIGFGAVRWSGMAGPVVWMGVSSNAGTTNLLLYQMADAGTGYALTQNLDISDNTGLIGTLSYFAA